MDDVLGYAGKHVVVTGAASGMGEQVAKICHELGAHVTALDVKPVSTPVTTSMTLDLLDQASIDAVVAEIDGPVDSVFSCAGLPGPPFTDCRPRSVNFIGARALIEGLLPKIPEGGVGLVHRIGRRSRMAAGARDVRAAARDRRRSTTALAWCEEQPRGAFPMGGYRMSKVVVNQYVAAIVCDQFGERGVRLNCLNPGPTRPR